MRERRFTTARPRHGAPLAALLILIGLAHARQLDRRSATLAAADAACCPEPSAANYDPSCAVVASAADNYGESAGVASCAGCVFERSG
eukprot:2886758-Prymnesium_polylepis.1